MPNIILDIDDTINNLTNYVCERNQIDINKYNSYYLQDTDLSEKECEIILNGYNENISYEKCHYYLDDKLFKKLSENNSIIFYTKCIKKEHIDIKHKMLERYLHTKIKKISKFDKNNIKNGIYYFPIPLHWSETKPPLFLNPDDYVIEDSISNLLEYDKVNEEPLLSPFKILMLQSFNKNEYEKIKNNSFIISIKNNRELNAFLEELNKSNYKNVKKIKAEKQLQESFKFSIISVIIIMLIKHNEINGIKDILFYFFFGLCSFLNYKIAKNNNV